MGVKLKKYSKGTEAVVAERRSLTGKIVKKAAPVAPAYIPSAQIKARPSGNSALNLKEGGDPMSKGRDLSGYVSGVNTKKQVVAGVYSKGTKGIKMKKK